MRRLIDATRLPVRWAGLTLVLYLVLAGMVFFWLVPHSGGRLPLDVRFPTYSVGEASTYLQLLPFYARDIYAGPVFWVDMLFPPALGVTLALWLKAWGVTLWRVGPLAYVLADWSENFLVGRLLAGLPDLPSVELIQMASYATLGKFVALVCTLALLLVTVLRERMND
ncbi:hypothetical protein [Pseudaestuariivita atlantica]|uniref:Uncharacterized protein n=1 Tax=Pseudaestuariivita atlantica TaxID=1317121 RepID=A0A0L1JTU8_9RHOB|nr:hypothetical protein [Pseudaestuariivita atlantica]KNG95199.1 hypothetical protein ATO11_00715 [Pseudaestuariivita atlantica]